MLPNDNARSGAAAAEMAGRNTLSTRHLIDLIVALALRDVSTRYKHSFLGLYWALINPLLTALIFAFVFGGILKVPLADNVPYPVFLVVNLTLWSFFANSLTSATTSVVSNAPLLAKIYFPRLILPTAAVVARLVDFAFSAAAAGLFMLVYKVPIGWALPAVLLPLMVVSILAFGCGYLLAASQVLYRDTGQIIGVLLMLWMYVSPVMYATSALPKGVDMVVRLNPVAEILEFAQSVVLMHTFPAPTGWMLYSFGVAVVVFVVGVTVFRKVENVFGEIL